MRFLGDFADNANVVFHWDTCDAAGAPATRDTNGTVYVEKSNASTGSGATVTKANPGVVTSTAHGLATGDEVFFYGMTEMTELNQTIQTATYIDANSFSINDTSAYGAAETTGGNWVQVNTADVTDSEDYKGVTGSHRCAVDMSADAYFATGADYTVYLLGAVIGTTTVNATLAHWSCQNRFMRGTDSALLAASAPTNFGDLAITATTGKVTVGTNDDKTGYTASTVTDKTGYSISGTKTTLDALNDVSTADVNAQCDTALADYDAPTKAEMDSAFTEIKGATWSSATDTLEHIRNKETDIETDTQDLQTQIGTAGAGLTDLGGMSVGMKAEVNAEADTAITDAKLDHLVAVAESGDVVDNSIVAKLASKSVTPSFASYDNTTDSLEAIRDRGDSAWTGSGSDPYVLVETTIATLTSQTSFTLTAGSADNNAYLNCTAVITDATTSTQKAIGLVSAYTGSTKTVTLKYDPGVFVMAAGDSIAILACNALKSTAQNRQLDVTAGGTAGIDWGNVENPTTAVDLAATDIQLCDTVTTNTDMRGTDSALLASSAPTNFGDLAITATTGKVTVGTNDDKTGYSISGTKTTLDALNDVSAADVNTQCDTAIADAKLDHLVAVAESGDVVDNSIIAKLASKSATPSFTSYDNTTDSLEAIRDRGDANWSGSGADPYVLVETTIATAGSQTSFTLTDGSADDGAYANCTVVITDATTSTQKSISVVASYTGSTKTVTLKYAPVFTMVAGDSIAILACNALKTTAKNRQLDVTVNGTAGIDWSNIENPTSAVDLAATDIQLCDTVTTNTDMRGTDSALLAASAPTNFGDLAITATTGKVTVGTNDDKAGYSISGTKTTLDALNDITAAAAADAVWDESTVGHTTGGTFGEQVKTDVDAILTDTADMQPKLGTPAADVSADIAAVKAQTAAIEVDTQDVQARLPSALVSGKMDADARAINGDATAASLLASSALGITTFTVEDHVNNSTTQCQTDLAETTDDHYNGRYILFTGGVLDGQGTSVTDYIGASGTLIFPALTEEPAVGQTGVIL